MPQLSLLTKTSEHKFAIIPRVLAGLPLLGFGALHFIKPDLTTPHSLFQSE